MAKIFRSEKVAARDKWMFLLKNPHACVTWEAESVGRSGFEFTPPLLLKTLLKSTHLICVAQTVQLACNLALGELSSKNDLL